VLLWYTSPHETLPGQGNRQTLNLRRGLTGQLHPHDPWAGEGPLVSMLRHTFPHPSPFSTRASSCKAPAPALQWASIVGGPGSRRTAHSAHAHTIWEIGPCGYSEISWIFLDNHRYPWISRMSFEPSGKFIRVRSLFGYSNSYPYTSCISTVIYLSTLMVIVQGGRSGI
jgi:hypothetical protein